jgi:ATP-dependent DNA helicase UvrD/PcrA
MNWDEGLGPEQTVAAGAPRGHAVLLAGPGTGKTFVLIRRVQFLVEEHGVDPTHITALTFSRAAAAEMRERLTATLGSTGRKVRVSTLHSYALQQLLAHGARQLPSPLRIADDWEEKNIVVVELARLLGRKVRDISNGRDGALDRLGGDWNTLDADGRGWEAGYPDGSFLSTWRQHRQVYGYTLRSELVYQLLSELRADPHLAPRATDVVLVDEYQDLNKCDLEAVRMISTRTGAEVYAAGDDDQSIYSFRQAAPGGIRDFAKDYPGSSKLVLRECMRCGPEIVDLANWLIQQEVDREPKELISFTEWDGRVEFVRFANQEAEAAALAKAVETCIGAGVAPERILILAKADAGGKVSTEIAEKLTQLGQTMYLPRGMRGPDPDELQYLVAYLVLSARITIDGRIDDLALRALLKLEDNDVGFTRILRVVRYAMAQSLRFSAAVDACRLGIVEGSGMQKVADAADDILTKARGLQPMDEEDFDSWLVRVADELSVRDEVFRFVLEISRGVSGEVAELEMESGDPLEDQARSANLVPTDFIPALLSVLSGLSDAQPPVMTGSVTFTTMHGAKGLTADVVFVLQAEDEVIPGTATGGDLD